MKNFQTRRKAFFPEKMCARHWCKPSPIQSPNCLTFSTGNLYTELWTKSQSNTSNRALGLPPTDSSELAEIISALDPTTSGFVPYSPFVSIAAAKLHSKGEDAISAEVDDAYQLFTRGTNGPITLSHLRRIARDLKEDGVGDDLLKDMILEGNGGAGLSAGVTLEQFHDVMTRAGVF